MNIGPQQAIAQSDQPKVVSHEQLVNIKNTFEPKPAVTKTQQFDAMLAKLREAQRIEQLRVIEAARVAAEQAAIQAAETARIQAQSYRVQRFYVSQVTYGFGQLIVGTFGYAIAGGNCVNQIAPGVRPGGNPSTWAVTTQTPYIGSAALFYYNHVARVVGIWSNGDVEVANENWGGVPVTRFPRSTFRGFR